MAHDGLGSIGDIRKKIHVIHDLIYSANHEAGHVIYGLLYFIKIEAVNIFTYKKSRKEEGFVLYDKNRAHSITNINNIRDMSLYKNRLYAEIGFSYAGLMAETYHFKLISGSDKLPFVIKEGSSDDIRDASYLFKTYNISLPGNKRRKFKKRIMKKVIKDLQNNWDDVILVAHTLLKKKKLLFSDLKTLLCCKSKKNNFWKKQFKLIALLHGTKICSEKKIKLICCNRGKSA